MTDSIKVKIKSVFGRTCIYPVCEKAEVFCELVGQSTLTEVDIAKIKKLGYEVQVVSDHPAKL